MAKRDCMHCANCTLRPMAHEKEMTNTCNFSDRIAKLSMPELKKRIETKECEWFETGTPATSDEVTYDD